MEEKIRKLSVLDSWRTVYYQFLYIFIPDFKGLEGERIAHAK